MATFLVFWPQTKWEKSQEINKSQRAVENLFHLFKKLRGLV